MAAGNRYDFHEFGWHLGMSDKNTPERVDFEQQQAASAFNRGDLAGAKAHFQAALEINRALGDRAGEAQCWHRLGSTAMAGGDLDAAAQSFETALGIREEIRDGAGYANSRHQLGMIAMQRGEFTEARKHSQAALKVQDEIGDVAGVGASLNQIAASYMEEGNVGEAVTGFRHAIKVLKSVQDLTGVSMAFYHMALMAERQARIGPAFKLMSVCASLQATAEHADAQESLQYAHRLAGQANIAPGDVDRALGDAVNAFVADDGAGLIEGAFPPESPLPAPSTPPPSPKKARGFLGRLFFPDNGR